MLLTPDLATLRQRSRTKTAEETRTMMDRATDDLARRGCENHHEL